jgi:hypothetical protein
VIVTRGLRASAPAPLVAIVRLANWPLKLEKLTRLMMLKNSPMNWRRTDSVRKKFFVRRKSRPTNLSRR